LNELVLANGLDQPGDILRELDHRVSDTLNKQGAKQTYQDGMDISLCTIDKQGNTMKYAGAFRPLIQISNEADQQYLAPFFGCRKRIVSINIGTGTIIGSFKINVGTDHSFSVIIRDPATDDYLGR
jgi:hypothetical protein